MLDSLFSRRRKEMEPSREFRVSGPRVVAEGRGPGLRPTQRPTRREEQSAAAPTVEGLHLALLASRSLLVAIKDLDGRYIEVNEAYARVLGLEVQAVCGRLDRDLLPADVAGELAKRERMAMRGVNLRPELEAFDRESPAYLVERLPIRDARGTLSGVCLVAMPAPTAAQRESVTEFPAVVDSAPPVAGAAAAPESLPESMAPSQPLPFPTEAAPERMEIPLAASGIVLIAMASAAERETLADALTGEGFAVATAATASEILLRLTLCDPECPPPAAILIDELLVRDAQKRQALLGAVEALQGGLEGVFPVVGPGSDGEPWGSSSAKTQPPLLKGSGASLLRDLLLETRSTVEFKAPAAAAVASEVWLAEPPASSELDWDAALYRSLLSRFAQRYAGFARAVAGRISDGQFAGLDGELGQLARGARNLGAQPLAEVAEKLTGVLRRGGGGALGAHLAELSSVLDATILVVECRVQATSDPFEWSDPETLLLASGASAASGTAMASMSSMPTTVARVLSLA